VEGPGSHQKGSGTSRLRFFSKMSRGEVNSGAPGEEGDRTLLCRCGGANMVDKGCSKVRIGDMLRI